MPRLFGDNLNGYEIDAGFLVSEHPFYVADRAELIINAEGATIVMGDYGLINVLATTKAAELS